MDFNSLLKLIGESLLLSEIKKRVLKKQVPFWSTEEQDKLATYLSNEASFAASQVKNTPSENLPKEFFGEIKMAIIRSNKKLSHCEEGFEQAESQKSLDKLISTL
jgi:uncharacterized protein YkwD